MRARYLMFDKNGGRLMGDTAHYLPEGAEHAIEAARELDSLIDVFPLAYYWREYAEMTETEQYSPGYMCVIVAHGLPIKRHVNCYDNARYLQALDSKDGGVVIQSFFPPDESPY